MSIDEWAAARDRQNELLAIVREVATARSFAFTSGVGLAALERMDEVK
jgi:hypothetical protein